MGAQKSDWESKPSTTGYNCCRCHSPAKESRWIPNVFVCSNPGCDCQRAEWNEAE